MQFMILRRADAGSEGTRFPGAQLVQALPQARWLHPSAKGARLTRSGGVWSVTEGPFGAPSELVAGFTFIEAASRQEAVEWAKRWPSADAEGQAVIEVREAGCSGGCAGFDTQAAPERTPYMVLLRADAASEADVFTPPEVIAKMMQANADGVRAGVVLAGEGLQPSSKGARVKFGGGKASIIDGPFTEVKELIAGFWLIQAGSMQQAVEWVQHYPFPQPDALQVELREIFAQGRQP